MAEQWQADIKAAFQRSLRVAGVKLREGGPMMESPSRGELSADVVEDVEAHRAPPAPEPPREEQEEEAQPEAEDEAPSEPTAEGDEPATEQDDTESDVYAEDEPDGPDPEALKKAKRYIKLKVNPPDKALDVSDEELLEWAERIRENEADIERMKAERASHRGGEEARNGEREPAPDVDFASLLAPLWEDLGLDGGSRAAQALLGALRATNGELVARVERAEEALRQREIRDVERTLERQRKRLTKAVPLLGRSLPAWRAVLGTAAEIARAKGLGDERALDLAVQALYDVRVLRGRASPMTPQRPMVEQAKSSKPPTKSEWDRKVFETILARSRKGQHTSPGEADAAALAHFGSRPRRTG